MKGGPVQVVRNRFDPHRLVTWRRLRVLQLVANRTRPMRPKRYDDIWVRRYWRFLVDLHAAPFCNLNVQYENYPEIYVAHQLFEGDPRLKAVVEARILARQTDAAIAENIGAFPGAIDAYEKIFFNVRDRLGARDYIINMILQNVDRSTTSDGTISNAAKFAVYRLAGYTGGRAVLDQLLLTNQVDELPENARQVEAWCNRTVHQFVRTKSLESAFWMSSNAKTHHKLLNLHSGIVSAEQRAQSSAHGNVVDYEPFIQAMLKGVPWGMMVRDTDKLSKAQRYYETTAIEPRAAQQVALARNQIPESLLRRELEINAQNGHHSSGTPAPPANSDGSSGDDGTDDASSP